jgi:hypothetical protein
MKQYTILFQTSSSITLDADDSAYCDGNIVFFIQGEVIMQIKEDLVKSITTYTLTHSS